MFTLTRRLAAPVAFVLIASAFLAQSPAAQAPLGATVALTGARLIDGTGRAPIDEATVIVTNGRIAAAGPAGSIAIPAGASLVDVSGKTIMPGLVNAHGHVRAETGISVSVRDQMIAQLRLYGQYGVTTVFSLGSVGEADEVEGIRLRGENDREALNRARIYTGGQVAEGKTPQEARASIDRLADLQVDIVKLRIDGNANDMTPETYGALLDQARRRGLRTAAHIFYLRDARDAVERGLDIIAHSVRDRDVDQAFIAGLKTREIGYIPTLTRDLSAFVYESTPAFFAEPFFRKGIAVYGPGVQRLSDPTLQEKTRNNPQAQAIKPALIQANRNLKLLSDAGVPIALGTDTGASLGRWQGYFEHVELEMMVQAGMTPMQVLVAATGGAARVMKVDDRLGTIEPGKWADLIVLHQNPLADIRNTREIDAVWIGGRPISEE